MPLQVNPNVPLDVQRQLRDIYNKADAAQNGVAANSAAIATKLGSDQQSLLGLAAYIRDQLLATGGAPLPIYQLPGYIPPAQAQILAGTHAQRANYAASKYGVGTFYYETDTTLLYVVSSASGSNQWTYQSGVYPITQGGLNAYASTLTTHDAGTLVYVTVYFHTLQWTGAAWNWGPGDLGSGYKQDFLITPAGYVGFILCNGLALQYLNPDGTLTGYTPPSLVANPSVEIAGGSYTGIGSTFDTGTGAAVKTIQWAAYFRI